MGFLAPRDQSAPAVSGKAPTLGEDPEAKKLREKQESEAQAKAEQEKDLPILTSEFLRKRRSLTSLLGGG